MTVHLLDTGERVSRKPHQCFDCYSTIPKGTLYRYSACVYEGRAYTLHHHIDCMAASDFYRKMHGLRDWDFDYDGIPPLADLISDAGEFEQDMQAMRGRFPHVVARFELREQKACLAST